MPDFEAPAIIGSAADNAVAYLIERVKCDSNFRHYMLATESLRLCLVAEAERLGLAPEAVEKITALHDAPAAKRDGKRTADIVILRERLDEVDQLVAKLHQRGKLTEDDYTALTNAIHGYCS